jgi:large subunit ribosomal protein L17
MAGSKPKFRHLSRNSAHRQALLRNLLDQVLEHESITTTWAKAKEVQKLVDKVVTMGKENTEESRRHAQALLYVRTARLVVFV